MNPLHKPIFLYRTGSHLLPAPPELPLRYPLFPVLRNRVKPLSLPRRKSPYVRHIPLSVRNPLPFPGYPFCKSPYNPAERNYPLKEPDYLPSYIWKAPLETGQNHLLFRPEAAQNRY